MKKTNRKGGHKLIVDQFQKIRKDHILHKEKPTQYQRVSHISPSQQKIECIWQCPRGQQVQCPFCSQSIAEQVIDSHKKMCQMKMQESQTKQRLFDKKQQSARAIKKTKNVTPGNPNSDYYPKNSKKLQSSLKFSHLDQPQNKLKRPSSAQGKSKQHKQRISTSAKEIDVKMTKKNSTSKFEQNRRKMNSSSNKDRKIEVNQYSTKNGYTNYLKNDLKLNKPVLVQPQPLTSGLRKKTVNHRPLRVEEISRRIIPKSKNTSKINQEEAQRPYEKPQQQRKEAKSRLQPQCFPSSFNQGREKTEKYDQNQFKHSTIREQYDIHDGQQSQPRFRQQPRQQLRQSHSRVENRSQRDAQMNRPNRNIRNAARRQNQARGRPDSRNQGVNRPHPTHNRTPSNFFTFVSQTINDQLQLMNSQFSMMSHVFENFNNYVNINIESHPTYFQYNNNVDSSDGYSDSSESYSDESDYYEEEQSEEEQGLNDYELDLISTRVYRSAIYGSNQCTICLIELKNGDSAKQLSCDHIFHSDCIDEWLRRKKDCPVCRKEVIVQGD